MKLPFSRKPPPVPDLPKLTRQPAGTLKSFFFPLFWGTADPAKVLRNIEEATRHVDGGFHFADNFFTWMRNNSMLEDGEFMRAWEANAESDSDKAIVWRRYVLACAGYHCVQLRGQFVECGAYTGVGVKTVVDYLGGAAFPKEFWVYDLFEFAEGMLHRAMPEHGKDLHERVRRKFEAYPQVRIFKGSIPEVFEGQSPDEIAYLHIDLNQAPAEIAALEALFDRVVPGGIVVLDDYEWSGVYRAQKQAEDPWFEARNYRVIPLPTGQGFVIKR
jgi:O-methyltransferase